MPQQQPTEHHMVITIWFEPDFRARLRGTTPGDPSSSAPVADEQELIRVLEAWVRACRAAQG